MEIGLSPDIQLALYLCMNLKDEKQMEVAHILHLLFEHKDISQEQLATVLSYIREVDRRCEIYNCTIG